VAQDAGDGVPESVARTLACLSEQRLEFGESLLDGIEVGAVGRQINQFGSHALDRLPDPGHLVAWQVIHDDGLACAESRGEDLFDIGAEGGAVHGAIEDIGRGDAGGPQTGDESGCFPMAVRNRSNQAQASGTPARLPGHVGRRRRLVNENKAFRIECGLAADEGVTGLGDIRTLLLGGVQTFFSR
jgi:hypothetical protein